MPDIVPNPTLPMPADATVPPPPGSPPAVIDVLQPLARKTPPAEKSVAARLFRETRRRMAQHCTSEAERLVQYVVNMTQQVIHAQFPPATQALVHLNTTVRYCTGGDAAPRDVLREAMAVLCAPEYGFYVHCDTEKLFRNTNDADAMPFYILLVDLTLSGTPCQCPIAAGETPRARLAYLAGIKTSPEAAPPSKGSH
jgi:hypothetical protein